MFTPGSMLTHAILPMKYRDRLCDIFKTNFSHMKRVAFILFCCFISMKAAVASEPDYVITDNQLYLMESLRICPILGFTGKNEEGRLRFKASEVQAYRKGGIVYWCMPVVERGQASGRYAFMELITTRGGLAVYRQTKYVDSWKPVNMIHVYKGMNYTLTVDEKNRDQLVRFFSHAM